MERLLKTKMKWKDKLLGLKPGDKVIVIHITTQDEVDEEIDIDVDYEVGDILTLKEKKSHNVRIDGKIIPIWEVYEANNYIFESEFEKIR